MNAFETPVRATGSAWTVVLSRPVRKSDSVPIDQQTLSFVMELTPRPIMTRGQVELMAVDNVASLNAQGSLVLG